MRLSKPFKDARETVFASGCFVPFVKGDAEHVERQAIAAKQCFGLPERAAIDPEEIADRVGVPLVNEYAQFSILPESIREQILNHGSAHWSAATLEGPAGELIIVNPTHAPTRIKVTIAEELSHLIIGHPPSEIDPTTGVRTYNRSVEEEAFSVGGALVMPYAQLYPLVDQGRPVSEIADTFGVSTQMANCRINRTGLRRMYNSRESA